MDGDEGRLLQKPGKPLTKLAKAEQARLSAHAITFRVLERYGIENYFPRAAMERIVKVDVSSYFPIPDHVPVALYLSEEYRTLWFHIRLVVAKIFKLPLPSPARPLYAKSRNKDIAELISLDVDLRGTDLGAVVMEAAQRARELSEGECEI
jgi:hypothetical protein